MNESAIERSAPTRDKVSILLVDDQPAKLMTVEAILADLGEEILRASSADEAMRLLLAHEIAVVLVDVCMPNMDGFELAELIRDHPRFGRTAIIFISAVHLTDADRLRGYGLGAVDYIPVPIIPEVLRAKVSVFCDLYRKTDELERLNAELKQRVEELDRSNERLRFTDRMATIGTLAAGLGHDMGNLLLPIRMRLDAIEATSLPDAAREDLAAIREASQYLQRLSNSLRLLSVDSESEAPDVEGIDLGAWWSETHGMLESGVARSAELSCSIPKELPRLRIGRAALTQIIFNLVQNSGDALKGRSDGRIEVAATTGASRGTVEISVLDNGAGMSDDAQRRCMEPFYTTKTRALSTGLGLALVGGLLKRAGGSLRIESTIGVGTRFTMELPTVFHRAASAEGVPAARRRVASLSLRDARLAAHMRSVLASLEYEVHVGDVPPEEADLWIAEADGNGAAHAARRFADSAPWRIAVLFAPGAALRAIGGAVAGSRVVTIEIGLRPSQLRMAIADALSAHAPATTWTTESWPTPVKAGPAS